MVNAAIAMNDKTEQGIDIGQVCQNTDKYELGQSGTR
jgi:hypothetical protein